MISVAMICSRMMSENTALLHTPICARNRVRSCEAAPVQMLRATNPEAIVAINATMDTRRGPSAELTRQTSCTAK
jgi:hypothetical protein